MNKIIIEGRICNELKTVGTDGLRFTVAVRRNYKNKQTGEYESDFVACTAWGATAGLIKQYFSKGDPIICIGEWRSGKYVDKNGDYHYTTECRINEIGFVTGAKLKGINTNTTYPVNPQVPAPDQNAPTDLYRNTPVPPQPPTPTPPPPFSPNPVDVWGVLD